MELELGFKLRSVADDFTSDFQIVKDRGGPVFVSTETDTMFFLTAHLKGYKRRNIKIDINEDGSLIGISGEKQVQETVMVGWKLYKKEAEIKGFKKVYRIPQGVILDKIKAKFNDDKSTLTITMPKRVKGIHGTAIEEVKSKPSLVREGSGTLRIAEERSTEATTSNLEVDEKSKVEEEKQENADDTKGIAELPKQHDEKKPENTDDAQRKTELPKLHDEGKQENRDDAQRIVESNMEKQHAEEKQENTDDAQEIAELPKQRDEEKQENTDDTCERVFEDKVGPSTVEPTEEAEEGTVEDDAERPQRFKMCMPIVAGSTLLLTFVVFVIQMIRSKHQISRKRD